MATNAMQTQPVPVPARASSTPASSPEDAFAGGVSMGGLQRLFASQRAAATQAQNSQNTAFASLMKLNEQTAQEHHDAISHYDDQMNAITQAMQRQRLVTINRAKIIKKTLPIIGLFALMAGGVDGISGAMSALAGGLAGLSQGLDKKYQEAWKDYDGRVKNLVEQAKITHQEMSDILKDKGMPVPQQIQMLKAVGASVPLVRSINTSEAGAYEKLLAAHEKLGRSIGKVESVHAQATEASTPPTQQEVAQAHALLDPKGAGTPGLNAHQIAIVAKTAKALGMQDDGSGPTYAQALHKVVATMSAQGITGKNFSESALDRSLGIEGAQGGYRLGSGARMPVVDGVDPDLAMTGAMYLLTGKSLYSLTGRAKNRGSLAVAASHYANSILQTAGLTLEDLPRLQGSFKAREHALSEVTRRGQLVQTYANELQLNIDKMLAAAKKVDLSKFKTWNAIELAAKSQTSNPEAAAYAQAALDVAGSYGKVLSGGTTGAGITDTQLRIGINALGVNMSYDALAASANQITISAKNAEDSFNSRADSLSGALSAMGLSKSVPTGTGAPQSGASQNPDEQAFMQVLNNGSH